LLMSLRTDEDVTELVRQSYVVFLDR